MIEVNGINYALTLYYSYLLPLFTIKTHDNKLVFTKTIGACKGLICQMNNKYQTKCIIPKNCSIDNAEKILGLDKRSIFHSFFKEIGVGGDNVYRRITLMHNSLDKKYVFTTIYLSRNTDYYRNTCRWIRIMHRNNCFNDPSMCLGIIKSYQYREYSLIALNISEILSTIQEPLIEALKLLELRGVGLKTINAYLLHVYGLTSYAPIDRYYKALLSQIGIQLNIPSKKTCIRYRLKCNVCMYRNKCIYGLTNNLFREYNGVLQSITYIYGRINNIVSGRINIVSNIEKELIKHMGSPIRIIDDYRVIINKVTAYWKR
jgi:hypothetical protein